MEEHKQTAPTKQEQHQPSTLSSHNITQQTRKRKLKFEGQTDFINEEARGANGTSAFRRQEAPMGMAFPCTYGLALHCCCCCLTGQHQSKR